jgi:hypothetical protein
MRIAEDLEVLRYGGPGHPEVTVDVPGSHVAGGEELDDATSRRIGKDGEGLHGQQHKPVRKLVKTKISADENKTRRPNG